MVICRRHSFWTMVEVSSFFYFKDLRQSLNLKIYGEILLEEADFIAINLPEKKVLLLIFQETFGSKYGSIYYQNDKALVS